MVAYSLYKAAKCEWLDKGPNEIERKCYHRTVTPTQIGVYRAQDEAMLSEFAESVVNDSFCKMQKNAMESAIVEEIRARTKFWMNVVAGAMGSFVFAVVILIGVAIWFSPSIKDMIMKLSA